MLVLTGAFAGLAIDVRIEHVEAVRDHSIAWLPIIYSGCMTTACLVALIFWNKIVRRFMLVLFLMSFVIGGLGFYLHNHGNIAQVVKTSVAAWIDPAMSHSDDPPQFAPLAFAGLGLIGALAALDRFNSI